MKIKVVKICVDCPWCEPIFDDALKEECMLTGREICSSCIPPTWCPLRKESIMVRTPALPKHYEGE